MIYGFLEVIDAQTIGMYPWQFLVTIQITSQKHMNMYGGKSSYIPFQGMVGAPMTQNHAK